MKFPFSNYMNIGTGITTALGSIFAGKQNADMIGHERKMLKVDTDLKLRSAGKKRRQAVGQEVSRVAGSGVELDLEDIARMESEYLMDEAVIAEKSRVEQRMMRSEQKTSKRMGYSRALTSLTDIGKGLSGTGIGKKFNKSPFGAWFQK